MEPFGMSTMKALSRNLAKFRNQRGLTLTGLAERCGVAKSTLSTLESTGGNPTVETLWAIANALEVPFGLLVSDADGDESPLAGELQNEGSIVRLIERSDGEPEIEAYTVELKAGYRQESAPHPKGVSERVTVLSGAMLVGQVERPKLVRSGDSYTFDADIPHVYGATEQGAKALVLIEYPPKALPGGNSVLHIDWPESDWDGVRSMVDRLLIEVSNGVEARLVRFRGCWLTAEEAKNTLREQLLNHELRPFSWPLLHLVGMDQHNPYLAFFPLRFTHAFSTPDICRSAESSLLADAQSLARLAESPFLPLPTPEMDRLRADAAGGSWVRSTLAAEVLTQRGFLTLPSRVRHSPGKMIQQSNIHIADQSFSSRIDVNHYDSFELLHPAYARQVVAIAEDIERYLGRRTPEHAIDVGTGPGIPLLMLHELHPHIRFLAIEPDEIAFACLVENIRNIPEFEAHQTGFLELDVPADETPLITSIGASHHFNTAFMLQKAMSALAPGGILIVADEFIPEFRTPEERNLALLRHHAAYILTSMTWIGKDETIGAVDWEPYHTIQHNLALALVDVEAGQTALAVGRCRKLYTHVKQSLQTTPPGHAVDAYTRFFWLELQAMVAGFDYEVERKTSPRRFLEFARFAGLELLHHRHVFATTATDEWGGGTHVFTFRKPIRH